MAVDAVDFAAVLAAGQVYFEEVIDLNMSRRSLTIPLKIEP